MIHKESIRFFLRFLASRPKYEYHVVMAKKQKLSQITIRIPASMSKQITARAEQNFRALNGEICALLQQALEQDNKKPKKSS